MDITSTSSATDGLAKDAGRSTQSPAGRLPFRSGVTTSSMPAARAGAISRTSRRTIIDRAGPACSPSSTSSGAACGGAEPSRTSPTWTRKATATCRQAPRRHRRHQVRRTTRAPNGTRWIARSRRAARPTCPSMVDFGNFAPARPFDELVTKHLRPGDIRTHMFRGRCAVHRRQRQVLDLRLKRAGRGVHVRRRPRRRQLRVADRPCRPPAGILPGHDHHRPAHRQHERRHEGHPQHDVEVLVPACRSPTSSAPPRRTPPAIKRPTSGTFGVGAEADVAVLRVREGEFGFIDRRRPDDGTQKLECELTLRAGQVVWISTAGRRQDWKTYYAAKPSSALKR